MVRDQVERRRVQDLARFSVIWSRVLLLPACQSDGEKVQVPGQTWADCKDRGATADYGDGHR